MQFSSEALTLLIVSIAFLAIVSWSMALFRMLERAGKRALAQPATDCRNMLASEAIAAKIVTSTMQASEQHRRRLIAACIIVLITFSTRAAFDFLFAYSTFDDPQNAACGQCDQCQSQRYLVRKWLEYTPEFQSIVVATSSPLPLTLSLWLITKAHVRARLIAADIERAHDVL